MDIPRITPREVSERLDAGERIAFLDARSPKALERATQQLPGSARVPSDDVERHVGGLPASATFVAYCT
jgi:rhodanese-related sulfurtransferase